MADPTLVLRLVADQNSPENALRKSAESEFNNLAAQNPSQLAYTLIQSAVEESLSIDIRQSCLLHLKRLVPKFWSLGFELFIGPVIDQNLKQEIRVHLIQLVTSTTVTKIRSGAAYVIVQIAAVDFPDEWPDLLTNLFSHATNLSSEPAVLGGLAVLTDLFDDLITEEQFWEGGVGGQLITHVAHILSQNLLPEIKTWALRLYLTVFNTLQSAEAMALNERRTSVTLHIVYLSKLLTDCLQSLTEKSIQSDLVSLRELEYRSNLYKVLSRVLSSFSKLVGESSRALLTNILYQDLLFGTKVVGRVSDCSIFDQSASHYSDSAKCVTNYLAELFQCLSLLQHRIALSSVLSDQFEMVVQSFVECAMLSEEVVDEYTADFNTFVTDITGLSGQSSVRDAIMDFLIDVNDRDAAHFFSIINAKSVAINLPWRLKEAYLFLTEALLLNEDAESLGSNLPLSRYVANINGLVSLEQGPANHPLLISRVFLVLPKFFEKFSNRISVNSFGAAEFKNTFLYSANVQNFDLFDLVQATALVCTTLWKNVPNLDLSALGNELQTQIIRVAQDLYSNSEEDSLPVLLEAISVAIDIDHHSALRIKLADDLNVIDLIFRISFKDSANIQMTISAAECIEELLTGILIEEYYQVCQKLIPFILDVINTSLAQTSVEYSPELYLALELLGYVVASSPSGDDVNNFPPVIFNYILPSLKKLILRTNDDQILQNSGEVFNNLLKRAPKLFVEYVDEESQQSGMGLLLEIANKFLSPSLSDSAAMSCGLIVISLFENFQSYLDGNFYEQLLQATVRRLVIATEVITIENLIMVFCKIVLNFSPEQLINALTGIQEDGKNGLQLVLPIWFNSFEITRGYEKIKQNILALGKIYSLNDEQVNSVVVDGDLIPYDGDMIITRSMAKNMPQQYTQVSASLKIIKLLVSELEFQCQQPDADDYLPGQPEEDDNEGDWEDLEDIGVPNYDKLKSYVDLEDEGDEGADQSILEMLVQFFRECAAKNLGEFEQYYDELSDKDKKVITESVAF